MAILGYALEYELMTHRGVYPRVNGRNFCVVGNYEMDANMRPVFFE